MTDKPTIDPIAMMQGLVSAWKQVAPPAPVESDLPGARMMAQALAAANMPSREDVGDLAARLDRVEEALARIERKLDARRRPKTVKAKAKN